MEKVYRSPQQRITGPSTAYRNRRDVHRFFVNQILECVPCVPRFSSRQGSWCPGPELNRYVPFGTRDFKLSRLARRPSLAGEIPSAVEGSHDRGSWCPGPELNRYVPFGTRDFKLSRLARRPSLAGEIPSAVEGSHDRGSWCPGPELNRYVPFGTRDFKLSR